jgi:hypothetical protein
MNSLLAPRSALVHKTDDFNIIGAPSVFPLQLAECRGVVELPASKNPIGGIVTTLNELLLGTSPALSLDIGILPIKIAESDLDGQRRFSIGLTVANLDKASAVPERHGKGEICVVGCCVQGPYRVQAGLEFPQVGDGWVVRNSRESFFCWLVQLLGRKIKGDARWRADPRVGIVVGKGQRTWFVLGEALLRRRLSDHVIQLHGTLPASNGILGCARRL